MQEGLDTTKIFWAEMIFRKKHRSRSVASNQHALVKYMIAWESTFVWDASNLAEVADQATYAVCIRINSIVVWSESLGGFICNE